MAERDFVRATLGKGKAMGKSVDISLSPVASAIPLFPIIPLGGKTRSQQADSSESDKTPNKNRIPNS